eukprot:TRINITY_DN30867_c0_g1_i1.p1 TRINITY_DN30867_c0_g1~~TRINITY_DN30867_c0_g1_i1.p1  ORF type:complete len:448 (-),score=94.30 TRINITY_DN30867_c0_g1_i1:78-1379(-)
MCGAEVPDGDSVAARCLLLPRNLAHASEQRRSWVDEFALARRCIDRGTGLANPHTWQRLALAPEAFPELDRLPLRRDLDLANARRRPYHRRKDEVKSTVHWGQRKLFMSELEFLLEHAQPPGVIVYAGAAPGGHLLLLCALFPEMLFEVYDPRPFDSALLGPGAPANLRVHQEIFTSRHAKSFAACSSGPVLFVSDIRTADWQQQGEEAHDAALLADLRAQRRWVERMRPARAMLKFRLPYASGVTEYLDGDIRLPVWGPQTTTECRLIVSGIAEASASASADGAPAAASQSLPVRRYDHATVSEQLFYFNTVARISVYPRPAWASRGEDDDRLLAMGLCRCFDCSREVDILARYLARSSCGPPSAAAVAALSGEVSKACGRSEWGLLEVFPAPWLSSSRLALSPDACRKRRSGDAEGEVEEADAAKRRRGAC